MNTEHLVKDALERSVSGIPSPEPNIGGLLAAGQAMRLRRAALAAAVSAVVVLVLVGVSVAWTGAGRTAVEPVPAGPSVTSETREATMVPADPPFIISGWVQTGRDVVDTSAHVAQFTVLQSGFVWVEDETSDPQIVFSGWQGGTKVLGHNPWPSVEPLSSTADNPRGLRRNVVGNPERNWLAWVEGDATQKEVVVAHATGAVARTAIPAAGPEWLDVLSVDAALVYLRRCPAPVEPVELPGGDLSERPTSLAGCSIWQWSWQLRNAVLLPSGHSWVEPDGTVVHDVTSGVWAVTRPGGKGLTFVSPQGGRHSDADVAVPGHNEGNGLSPDGRFWFSPGSRNVIVTGNGEIHSLGAELSRVGIGDGLRFVWIEPTTVMVVDGDTMTTCDAVTVSCNEPSDVGTLLTNAILPVQ